MDLLSHHIARNKCFRRFAYPRPFGRAMPAHPSTAACCAVADRLFLAYRPCTRPGTRQSLSQTSSLELSLPAFPRHFPQLARLVSVLQRVLFLVHHHRSCALFWTLPGSSVRQPLHPMSGLPLSGIRAASPAPTVHTIRTLLSAKSATTVVWVDNENNCPEAKA